MPAERTLTLIREIRFAADEGLLAQNSAVTNSHAGWPTQSWIAPFLTLRVLLMGRPDSATGMLVNIVQVDEQIRRGVLPAVIRRLARERCTVEQAAQIAARACADLDSAADSFGSARICAVRLAASPYLSAACGVSVTPKGRSGQARPFPVTPSTARPTHLEDVSTSETNIMNPTVFLTQQFEFAASHRLHSPALSAADNRQVFGKCNNPAGHGHNYLLDVTLKGSADRSGCVFPLIRLEEIVKTSVLDVMDHHHLTAEVSPFSSGVNSTVEQIARVCFEKLNGQFSPAVLHRVRVWETPKTYAEVFNDEPTLVDSL